MRDSWFGDSYIVLPVLSDKPALLQAEVLSQMQNTLSLLYVCLIGGSRLCSFPAWRQFWYLSAHGSWQLRMGRACRLLSRKGFAVDLCESRF